MGSNTKDKRQTCPQCKGAGKVTITASEYGKPGETKYKIECPTCKGAKTVTAEVVASHKAFQTAWCQCGNPSGQMTFHDDGQHPTCSKHCYTCDDCQKLLQIG